MNRLYGLSALASLLLVAYVPAPAAAVVCVQAIDYCTGDCTLLDGCCGIGNVDLCGVTVEPVVQDNGDGTTTVGVYACTPARCYSVVRTVATDPCATVNCSPDVCTTAPAACSLDDLCFTHNPGAVTNMCVTTGSDPETISHPTVGITSRRTCLIGEEVCQSHPWATTAPGGTTLNVPTVDGYVEATILCGFMSPYPCGVTLP